jgi:hypothetical protein
MTNGSPNEVIVVAGERVSLLFEAEAYFTGNVDVLFSVATLDGPPNDSNRTPVPQARFQRTLPATSKPPGSDPTRKRSSVDWTVELPALPDFSKKLCIVAFEATGVAENGRKIRAHPLNCLRVPGIAITDVPELQAIMLHEFAKPDGPTFVLDTAALEQRIAQLTVEQRKLLATYDIDRDRRRYLGG